MADPPVDPPSQSVLEPASGALLVAGLFAAGWTWLPSKAGRVRDAAI